MSDEQADRPCPRCTAPTELRFTETRCPVCGWSSAEPGHTDVEIDVSAVALAGQVANGYPADDHAARILDAFVALRDGHPVRDDHYAQWERAQGFRDDGAVA